MASANPKADRWPLIALVLLSPVLAEMLSGSSPPLEWLNPLTPIFLVWLYGAGVLVMREASVRWRVGWPGLLLLGVAYGIIEEGLAVKSFFDPAWMDLGDLAWYGRWLDTNWVWAVWLSIYHAVFSIALPVFLVEWRWPAIRGRPLVSRNGYVAAIGILAAATIFLDGLLTSYRPSPFHLIGAALAVVCLAWAAKGFAGRLWARLPTGPPPSRRVYGVAGFAFVALSFLVYAGGSHLGVFPIVTILEGGVVLVAALLLLRRTSDEPRWARHRFAFAAGAIGFFIALATVLELAGNRGMIVVAVAFGVLLVLLYRREVPEDRVSESSEMTAGLSATAKG